MDSEIEYLLSLQAVRERANIVLDIARTQGLNHFQLNEEKLNNTADYVIGVIKVRPLVSKQGGLKKKKKKKNSIKWGLTAYADE